MTMVETLTETFTKRGPGRPRIHHGDKSAVRAALDSPLPASVADAVAKFDAAKAAFDAARSARATYAETATDGGKVAAERALNRALIQRDLAEQNGPEEDTPSEAEVAELQKAFDVASAAHDGKAARLAAYDEEVESRMANLDAARMVLHEATAKWRSSVMSAAENQLALAAQLAGEAQHAVAAINLWRGRPAQVRFNSFASEASHYGPKHIEISAEVGGIARRLLT